MIWLTQLFLGGADTQEILYALWFNTRGRFLAHINFNNIMAPRQRSMDDSHDTVLYIDFPSLSFNLSFST